MQTIFTLPTGGFNPNGLVDFILTLIVIAAFNVFVVYFVKRKFPIYTTIGFSVGLIIACILNYPILKRV